MISLGPGMLLKSGLSAASADPFLLGKSPDVSKPNTIQPTFTCLRKEMNNTFFIGHIIVSVCGKEKGYHFNAFLLPIGL